jgi:hypothetical protein
MGLCRALIALVAVAFLVLGICGDRCGGHEDDHDRASADMELHVGCHCSCHVPQLPEPIVVLPAAPVPAVARTIVAVQCSDQWTLAPELPPNIAA